MIKQFERLLKLLTAIGAFCSAGFLVGNMLLVIAFVLYRGLFGRLVVGIYELVEMTIVVAIAYAFSKTTLDDEHVSVRILQNRLSGGPRRVLQLFIAVVGLGFWTFLAVASYMALSDKMITGEITQELRFSVLPFRGIWLSAVALCALIALKDAARTVSQMLSKER